MASGFTIETLRLSHLVLTILSKDLTMNTDWQKNSDQELIDEAQTGMRGSGATVEMQRRLKDAMAAQTQAMASLEQKMFWLTIVGTILALIQTIPLLIDFVKWLKG